MYKGILDHERKRKLEVKCMELADQLEEQGYEEKIIEEKVDAYRSQLLSKEVYIQFNISNMNK